MARVIPETPKALSGILPNLKAGDAARPRISAKALSGVTFNERTPRRAALAKPTTFRLKLRAGEREARA